jgi:SAM-dependent methyltransferase
VKTPAFFAALPPYLGSKKRLAPLILACLSKVLPREAWTGAIFLDPMCGSGAVALLAKAYGFDVRANDAASRAACVARALVENDDRFISLADVQSLWEARAEQGVASASLVPSMLDQGQAQFADGALAFIRRQDDATLAALLRLVVVTWVLRLHPMTIASASDAPWAHSGQFDRVSPARLGHYLRRRGRPSRGDLLRIAQAINRGVFPGRGSASQTDAREFLARQDGDVVYLDPPYAGTTRYDTAYGPLDLLLDDGRVNDHVYLPGL